MLAFARFMNSVAGRRTRLVGGGVMIIAGLVFVGGPAGIVLAAVGLVPLLAGAFDICVMAPVIHTPFSGSKVRPIVGRGGTER
jgi:Na+/alanine symporter